MATSFTVNGDAVSVDVDSDTPLLWVLRDELRLTGTKFGGGIAQRGACTVHANGLTRRACVTPVGTLEGSAITTIEGLDGDVADAVQVAWQALDVPQCGFCQSGQVVSAAALMNENRRISDEDIDSAMAGNLCRRATYVRIRGTIHDAAKTPAARDGAFRDDERGDLRADQGSGEERRPDARGVARAQRRGRSRRLGLGAGQRARARLGRAGGVRAADPRLDRRRRASPRTSEMPRPLPARSGPPPIPTSAPPLR